MKKNLSLLLALVMLISTSSFAMTANAGVVDYDSPINSVISNSSLVSSISFSSVNTYKTKCPSIIIESSLDAVDVGNTVTYSVYFSPHTEAIFGVDLVFDIPNGLTFVDGSASMPKSFADEFDFKYFALDGGGDFRVDLVKAYGVVFSEKTLVGSFDCKVNENATDAMNVSLSYSEFSVLVNDNCVIAPTDYYSIIPATVTAPHRIHTLMYHKKVDATCAKTGKIAYYSCNVCGKNFSDSNAVYEIKNLVIPKTDEHENPYFRVDKKASFTLDGVELLCCEDCGKIISAYSISAVSTPKLSTTTYTYNGKVKKPSVDVMDKDSNWIYDYTVTYASGRKNVGKYAVKVKLKGSYYTGTKTVYFTIKPKSTTISKVTASKKTFTVKWKKQSTQSTGYQIQYSTDKNFKKNNKTVIVSKNKTTSKKISELKAKKKYYVRVRTYKTVKVNGKSTKIYSSWSKAKSVTTKK